MAQRVEVAPGTTLPFLSTPHDTLRHGLPALKADAQVVHPVDTLQRQGAPVQTTAAMQASVYGTAFPARRAIESQIVGRVQRLPGTGLPNARLGMEVLTGDIYDFGFDSYLGFPGEKESAPAGTPHSVMEHKLGLTQKGAPAPSRPGM